MNIKTFEINGNNRIIVNGTKIMWATLSDIETIGSPELTYREKFEVFVKAKENNTEPPRYIVETDKKKNNKKRNRTQASNDVEIDTFTIVYELLDEYISNKSKEIYAKYKKYMCADVEDIKSELQLYIYDKVEHLKGTNRAFRQTAINTFTYNLNRDVEKAFIKKLSGYTYGLDMNSVLDNVNSYKEIHAGKCLDISDIKKEIVTLNNTRVLRHLSIDEFEIPSCIDGIDVYESALITDELIKSMSTLTIREQIVLIYRFLYTLTLEQTGNIMCTSRERTRQIEMRALHKLRHPSRSRNLKDYFDNDIVYVHSDSLDIYIDKVLEKYNKGADEQDKQDKQSGDKNVNTVKPLASKHSKDKTAKYKDNRACNNNKLTEEDISRLTASEYKNLVKNINYICDIVGLEVGAIDSLTNSQLRHLLSTLTIRYKSDIDNHEAILRRREKRKRRQRKYERRQCTDKENQKRNMETSIYYIKDNVDIDDEMFTVKTAITKDSNIIAYIIQDRASKCHFIDSQSLKYLYSKHKIEFSELVNGIVVPFGYKLKTYEYTDFNALYIKQIV